MTLVHFGDRFDGTVKPWVLPDITNRVKERSIIAKWHSRVVAITPEVVEIVADDGCRETLPADHVLAMTGYYADTTLLERLGVPVDAQTGIPAHDEKTHDDDDSGVLPGWSHREREGCQPPVHRERAGARRAHRRGM